jgi:hypothetical protein
MGNALDRMPVDAWRPTVRPAPAPEPLQVAHCSLFGIPLAVRSNDKMLLGALASSCDASPVAAGRGARTIDLTLIVDPALVGSGSPAPRVEGLRMAIDGPGLAVRADAARAYGSCRLSPELRDDVDQLRDAVLDPLLLFLVTRQGRAPLHAAGFLADDVAIVLAGPSGAGKSCLTLAAHRAGFAPLSDDIVFVEAGARPRVWGLPRPIHLFAEDAPGDDQALRLRNGKFKRPIALWGDRAPRRANRAALCLLRFGDAVALEALDPSAAVRGFAVLEPGFDLLAGDIAAAVAALARQGAWSLTLSDRPEEAIALLADKLPLLRGGR